MMMTMMMMMMMMMMMVEPVGYRSLQSSERRPVPLSRPAQKHQSDWKVQFKTPTWIFDQNIFAQIKYIIQSVMIFDQICSDQIPTWIGSYLSRIYLLKSNIFTNLRLLESFRRSNLGRPLVKGGKIHVRITFGTFIQIIGVCTVNSSLRGLESQLSAKMLRA